MEFIGLKQQELNKGECWQHQARHLLSEGVVHGRTGRLESESTKDYQLIFPQLKTYIHGRPLEKDVRRDFQAIIRRTQIYRTAYPAMDMAAHEDVLETVAYMLMYLKYENPHSNKYGRVVIEADNTDQIGEGWNYFQ